MDNFEAADILMDDDSDFDDINLDSDEEIVEPEEEESDMNIADNEDANSTSAANAIPPTGPAQLQARRQGYVWHSTIRPPQQNTFTGTPGPTNQLDVRE